MTKEELNSIFREQIGEPITARDRVYYMINENELRGILYTNSSELLDEYTYVGRKENIPIFQRKD